MRFNFAVACCHLKSVRQKILNCCYLCHPGRRKSSCCLQKYAHLLASAHRLKGRRQTSSAMKANGIVLERDGKLSGTKKPGEKRELSESANSMSLETSQRLKCRNMAS